MNVGEAITAGMQEDRQRDSMAFLMAYVDRVRIHYNAGQLETLRLARAGACPTCGR